MKMMKDFYDLYLKCDVLLLTYVFQKFRNNYGLCPSHYLSAPAFSSYAMLNMTKIKLGLILDPDMYMFFEKGMRGGVSYISNRHSKANNKYLKSYDPKQESKHTSLNANNLYDYATCKFLPTSGFKWIDSKEFDLNKYTSNILKGCILEVDLEYPKELRELRNDYPLAPNKMEIKREMLPDHQLNLLIIITYLLAMVKISA